MAGIVQKMTLFYGIPSALKIGGGRFLRNISVNLQTRWVQNAECCHLNAVYIHKAVLWKTLLVAKAAKISEFGEFSCIVILKSWLVEFLFR